MSKIMVAKSSKTRTELLTLVCEQKLEGKTYIAEFIANRGSNVLQMAWEMEGAQETLE